MHEMSYVVRLVNLALKKCEEENISNVKKVVSEIGEMTGILPEYMIKYYKSAVKDTILSSSELECIMIPVSARCEDCGKEYLPDKEHDYLCPNCKSGLAKIIHGREFILKEIIAENE
ncbi:hydrogenase maturation nickel metallochaperone HypA [Lachnospiraceae bacterium C1.1]|nr:hydrogenase maturation nickel metallochaperone HypA [Lachnospiraceae bacterium C1.1]